MLKLIDLKKNLTFYSVEILRQYKASHEDRIKIQTSIDESRKTTAIRIQSNIRGRRVDISSMDAYNALINSGRYPNDEKGILIDLTNLQYSNESHSWNTAVAQINNTLDKALMIGNDEKKEDHFSIFGIAPIPILAYFGFKLGNTTPADIYIKLREQPWSINSSSEPMQFTLNEPASCNESSNVALLISISGTIKEQEAYKHIQATAPMYEIRPRKSQIDQIQSIDDLESFRKIYRQTIDQIREQHGKKCNIHVFGAIPTSVAVICGRELLHGVDPTLIMYEFVSQEEGFRQALKIN
ncbi:MAG: SAVED domain-containing protein [Bacteroidetes bacterium]|nr:SAVED domain-containing protein [Bacteroidota bacterium]